LLCFALLFFGATARFEPKTSLKLTYYELFQRCVSGLHTRRITRSLRNDGNTKCVKKERKGRTIPTTPGGLYWYESRRLLSHIPHLPCLLFTSL